MYEKDGVKFELDSYTSPEIIFVVGIEGHKEKVDFVYKEVSSKL